MTLLEYIAKLKAAKSGLADFQQETARTMGLNAKEMIQTRRQERGENANGESADYAASYKAYKQRLGKYRGFIDLTLTGRMWASVGIIEEAATQDGYTIKLGPTGSDNIQKMRDNVERYGPIMELNTTEEGELTEEQKTLLKRYFDQHVST